MNTNNENAFMHVETIQEMKDSQVHGLTYGVVAFVKDIFRTKEGLNIFTINDGQQDFKIVKFISGGIAHPEIDKGSIAYFKFIRQHYEGDLQGKLDSIESISTDKKEDFVSKKKDRELSQFKPVDEKLVLDTPAFKAMKNRFLKVASIIRQAVIEHRPIIISHHNDVDGFSSGIILEDAIKPLIEKNYPMVRFMNNYLTRYPSRTPYYDVVDATKDIGIFLQNMDRADTNPPLVVVVDNGSSPQDLMAIQKVKLFGADVVVIDHHDPRGIDKQGQSLICKETLAHSNPHLEGIKDNISASLLSYQVAFYINEKASLNKHAALLGAISDHCDGDETNILISDLNTSKEHYQTLALIGDYEIYQTKMNLQNSALNEFFRGNYVEDLLNLYKKTLDVEREEIKKSVLHYQEIKKLGKYDVHILDGELTTFRGDYYLFSKLAAILHTTHESELNSITCVYSSSFVVFRVRQENDLFDVNKLIQHLKEKIPHARISGGGHAVAGSIKSLPIAMNEVLKLIYEYISNL